MQSQAPSALRGVRHYINNVIAMIPAALQINAIQASVILGKEGGKKNVNTLGKTNYLTF